ncbi:hypothetical protein Q8F55_000650 [Vanrija albida]|uniref:C2H2-type domain-containing protein n=1 Tax=Vanrija albida TaxID=181172 RepID=A0ABR3QDW5_9TREE
MVLVCDECGLNVPYDHKLALHRRAKHPDPNGPPPERIHNPIAFFCDVPHCNHAGFRSHSGLIAHKNRPHPAPPPIPAPDGESSSQPSACGWLGCGLRFFTESDRDTHQEREHLCAPPKAADDKYYCNWPECHGSYVKPYLLKPHKETSHLKTKERKARPDCPEPDCTFSFWSDVENAEYGATAAGHAADTPFLCSQCPAGLKSKQDLHNHCNKYHFIPIVCEICHEEFPNGGNFDYHQRTAHTEGAKASLGGTLDLDRLQSPTELALFDFMIALSTTSLISFATMEHFLALPTGQSTLRAYVEERPQLVPEYQRICAIPDVGKSAIKVDL